MLHKLYNVLSVLVISILTLASFASVTVPVFAAGAGTLRVNPSFNIRAGDQVRFELTGGPPGGTFCIGLDVDIDQDCPSYIPQRWDEYKNQKVIGTIDADGNGESGIIAVGKNITERTTVNYVAKVWDRQDFVLSPSPSVKVSITPAPGTGTGGGGGGTSDCTDKAADARGTLIKDSLTNDIDDIACLNTLLSNSKVWGDGFNTQYGYSDAGETIVRAFQTKNGLTVDGKVGGLTWAKMYQLAGITVTGGGSGTGGGGTGTGSGTTGGGSGITSGLDCKSVGLVEVNGLCFPENQVPKGNGIVSCSTLGGCMKTIINILLTLAGIIAVLFLIVGGYRYITSAGNEKQAESGKQTVINALIGLGIVILAFTIVSIINNTLTRNSIT